MDYRNQLVPTGELNDVELVLELMLTKVRLARSL